MDKKKNQPVTPSQFIAPPVVAVLGHVDHGKTTLLDTIRKTAVAAREHGGITQKIGASTIEVPNDSTHRRITFIDTPGHEAFMQMRGRGAQASDLALLIVSSVDGVMPQTKESIRLLKETKLPFIVVLTKSDLPDKNPTMVKKQLAKEEILVEGFGGNVPIIEVSAKSGQNIQELLELILLVWDVNVPQENLIHKPFKAIVIESKLDTKSGSKATIVVKQGKVSIKDDIYSDNAVGRVRMLLNDRGVGLQTATVGDAIEVLGFEKVPTVGSTIFKKGEAAVEKKPQEALAASKSAHKASDDEASLSVIICADSTGSLEAILNALPKEVYIVAQKTGEISEADVLMAKSTGAIMLGFNAKVRGDVSKLAVTEKVLLKNYSLIYELLDEIKDVLEGKKLALVEQIYGKAKILATFPFDKQTVIGIAITEGRVAKGDRVRIERRDEIIGESNIASLRQGKDTVSKVESGNEAGIIISPALDFAIGDMVICHG